MMKAKGNIKVVLATIVSMFLLMSLVVTDANAVRIKGEITNVLPANTSVEKVVTSTISFIKKINLKNTKPYGENVVIINAKLPRRLHQGQRIIIHTSTGKLLAKILAVVTPKTSVGKVEKIFKHKKVTVVINDLKRKRVVILTTKKEIKVKKQQKVLIFIQKRTHKTMMEGC